MSIESVMPSNHLILCHPILLLPSILPSISVFSNELALSIRWPKYWSFSFRSILPTNIQGFFPLGLTDLLSLFYRGFASLLQHYSSKSSVLQWSALFTAQLSLLYMTAGKIIALTRQTFVSKVLSLLSNVLSRFWDGNRQEVQGSTKGKNMQQGSDIFSLLSHRRKQTSVRNFPFTKQI